MELFEDIKYESKDFTKETIAPGEYEQCVFINCNFSYVDLSGFIFIDCRFIGSNLSLIKLNKVVLRDVAFTDCKMIGLQFGAANEFGLSVSFDNCVLTNCSFYQAKMKNTMFLNSKLNEVDFSACDLSGSTIKNCDLTEAVFEQTNAEKVDFRTSINYSIDVERNNIKKSKHSADQLGGLLEKYGIIID